VQMRASVLVCSAAVTAERVASGVVAGDRSDFEPGRRQVGVGAGCREACHRPLAGLGNATAFVASTHGRLVSVRPIITRAKSTAVPGSASVGTRTGWARGSVWIRSSQIRQGLSTRIRQERAPKEFASSGAWAA
jgi:hypothetical protein